MQAKQFYVFGPFRFDQKERLLLRDGKPIPLSPKTADTLLLLVQNAGHLVEKDDLIRGIWPDSFVEDGNLTKNVFTLRKTLGQWDGGREYIETVSKRGYRFVASVNRVNEAEIISHPDQAKESPTYFGDTALVSTVATKVVSRSKYRPHALIVACLFLALGGFAALRVTRPTDPKVLRYSQITRDGKWKDELLTDGPRLYFKFGAQSGVALGQVASVGGEVAEIPIPFRNFSLQDISPHTSELLVLDKKDSLEEQPAYALPLPTGAPRRLGGVIARAAAWSPDGQGFAYGFDKDLYVAPRDGNAPHKLITTSGFPDTPSWSPDGRRIRFAVATQKDSSLWELSSDGNGLHALLPGWNKAPMETGGQWTPDGRFFLFLSARDGVEDVWAIREGGGYLTRNAGRPVRLSSGNMKINSFTLSKDGKQLFMIAGKERGELVRYDAHLKQFVPYLGGISAFSVSFSRDGQRLAYTDTADGTLWESKIDGTERVQLTTHPMYGYKARWSPDGSQLAFIGIMPGQFGQVFVVPSGGGSPHQVTADTQSAGFVYWSPDGKSLLIGNWNPETQEKNFHTIHCYFLDLETTKRTDLAGSDGFYGPHWSPNGRYIVAKSQNDNAIMLLDLHTSKWMELLKIPTQWISWSHDSQYVYFKSNSSGTRAFYRVRISDRKRELITSLDELYRLGLGVGDGWVGLAPDDSLLALRDVSTYDIYALDLQWP